MKIINYTIAEDGENMEGRFKPMIFFVKELIEAGWQPYGQPFVVHNMVRQAMVKYEQPDNKDQ